MILNQYHSRLISVSGAVIFLRRHAFTQNEAVVKCNINL